MWQVLTQCKKRCLFVNSICPFQNYNGARDKDRKRARWDVSVEFLNRHFVFLFQLSLFFANPKAGPERFGSTLGERSMAYRKWRASFSLGSICEKKIIHRAFTKYNSTEDWTREKLI